MDKNPDADRVAEQINTLTAQIKFREHHLDPEWFDERMATLGATIRKAQEEQQKLILQRDQAADEIKKMTKRRALLRKGLVKTRNAKRIQLLQKLAAELKKNGIDPMNHLEQETVQ